MAEMKGAWLTIALIVTALILSGVTVWGWTHPRHTTITIHTTVQWTKPR